MSDCKTVIVLFVCFLVYTNYFPDVKLTAFPSYPFHSLLDSFHLFLKLPFKKKKYSVSVDLCISCCLLLHFNFFKCYEIRTKLYNFSLPFPPPQILLCINSSSLSNSWPFKINVIAWVYVQTYILLNIARCVCVMWLVCMFSGYPCILAICILHTCWAGNLMHFSGESVEVEDVSLKWGKHSTTDPIPATSLPLLIPRANRHIPDQGSRYKLYSDLSHGWTHSLGHYF